MKLAVVTPWFSESPSGGAERHAGALVRHLRRHGYETELITTCARDPFHPWGENYYSPGLQEVLDLQVRRFPVRARNIDLYNQVHGKLLAGGRPGYVEQLQWQHETINSDAMMDFVEANGDDYVYFFMPYLYGTTFWGLQVRPDRSFLIPCLHDESYAYLASTRHLLEQARGVLFNTQPEMTLAQEICSLPDDRVMVGGEGVEIDVYGDAERATRRFGLTDPYVLYVGRKVAGKNVKFLLDCFRTYKQEHPGKLKLILAGTGDLDELEPGISQHPDIIDLGPVEEQEKYDLIKGSLALCQPSVMESFSIVLMEAWLMETPVVVHSDGQVTRNHCEVGGGGFAVGDASSFTHCVTDLLQKPALRNEMGRKGYQYVMDQYSWDNVIPRIIAFVRRQGLEV